MTSTFYKRTRVRLTCETFACPNKNFKCARMIKTLLAFGALFWVAEGQKETAFTRCKPTNESLYHFEVELLNKTKTDLRQYEVYTKQYLDFNGMIEKYRNKDGDLMFLAFPSNQFDLQEPGENYELLNGLRYVRPGGGWMPHPNLHIYGKLEVNGKNEHPMYTWLKSLCPQTVNEIGNSKYLMYNPIRVNDLTWNFEKFLIDRQGRPRYRFNPAAWQHGNLVDPYLKKLVDEPKSSL